MSVRVSRTMLAKWSRTRALKGPTKEAPSPFEGKNTPSHQWFFRGSFSKMVQNTASWRSLGRAGKQINNKVATLNFGCLVDKNGRKFKRELGMKLIWDRWFLGEILRLKKSIGKRAVLFGGLNVQKKKRRKIVENDDFIIQVVFDFIGSFWFYPVIKLDCKTCWTTLMLDSIELEQQKTIFEITNQWPSVFPYHSCRVVKITSRSQGTRNPVVGSWWLILQQ